MSGCPLCSGVSCVSLPSVALAPLPRAPVCCEPTRETVRPRRQSQRSRWSPRSRTQMKNEYRHLPTGLHLRLGHQRWWPWAAHESSPAVELRDQGGQSAQKSPQMPHWGPADFHLLVGCYHDRCLLCFQQRHLAAPTVRLAPVFRPRYLTVAQSLVEIPLAGLQEARQLD